MTEAAIPLSCFIIGDRPTTQTIFVVSVLPADTIEHLKQLIWIRNQGTFTRAGVDDRDLQLWRASFRKTDIASRLAEVQRVEEVDGLLELQTGQTIIGPTHQGVFEEPPTPDDLHIIVQPLISGE
jgi:hypothetical protein